MQSNLINQNIIITESSKNLRTLGRNALAGKWQTAILAVLIVYICILVPYEVFNGIFGVNVTSVLDDGNTYGMNVDTYSQLYNAMPRCSTLSLVYVMLVAGALTLGQSLFFLAAFRKHDVSPTDVFLGFEKFGKALGLFLYIFLFTYLWSLLFIIPGIIAAIRYSQAFFIMADDPSKGIRQCMNESKAMMKGNKAKFFCMRLSFIGWGILAAIPAGILSSIGGILTTNQFVITVLSFIGSLFAVPVQAYIMSTCTGFYEILAGHLIKETSPVPVTIEEAKALNEKNVEDAKPTPEAEAETAKEAEMDQAQETQETQAPEETADAQVNPYAPKTEENSEQQAAEEKKEEGGQH